MRKIAQSSPSASGPSDAKGGALAGYRPARILLATLALAVAALFLISCSGQDPMNTLAAEGEIARKQQDLFWLIFYWAVGVFVFVEGLLLIAVIRFRRKPGQGMPAQIHGNTRMEIAWTIIPSLVLVSIGVPTIFVIFDTAETPPEALRVNVIGHQWWWEFEYTDLDVVTANELHIPVGEAIALSLESVDVIHSFWVPKLAGKQDVIPRQPNPMWLRADKPGTYLGQCAELCGIQHANMRLRVIVQPRDEFDAWVSAQRTLAAPPPETLAPTITQCFACHTINGVPGAVGKIGPNLTHVGSRTTIAAGIMSMTDENLAGWLRDPQEKKQGANMQNLGLNDEQIAGLVEYLQSLK